MVRRKVPARSHNGSQARTAKSSTHTFVNRSRKKIRQVRVLKEIRYLRHAVKLLIPKTPFARLIREIIFELFPSRGIDRIQATALEALQEAAESYLVQFFEDCSLLSHHAKRVTLKVQDMILMRRLRGRGDIINK